MLSRISANPYAQRPLQYSAAAWQQAGIPPTKDEVDVRFAAKAKRTAKKKTDKKKPAPSQQEPAPPPPQPKPVGKGIQMGTPEWDDMRARAKVAREKLKAERHQQDQDDQNPGFSVQQSLWDIGTSVVLAPLFTTLAVPFLVATSVVMPMIGKFLGVNVDKINGKIQFENRRDSHALFKKFAGMRHAVRDRLIGSSKKNLTGLVTRLPFFSEATKTNLMKNIKTLDLMIGRQLVRLFLRPDFLKYFHIPKSLMGKAWHFATAGFGLALLLMRNRLRRLPVIGWMFNAFGGFANTQRTREAATAEMRKLVLGK